MTTNLTDVNAQVRFGYVQAGKVRLHYAERGEGDQIVVLLHGFPECWYSWRHQLMALSDTCRVIAPDLRGYNLSDKPGSIEDYAMRELVADVHSLITHFGQSKKAVVVGHDWGAAIAWALAKQNPESIAKLAALQVPPATAWRDNLTLQQILRSWYMLFFQLPRLPEWFISLNNFALLERGFSSAPTRTGTFNRTDIAIYKEALRRPGALTAAINYYRANFRALWQPGSDEQLISSQPVRVPTLFIYGESDPYIHPATVRNVQNYVAAGYEELRIPACGHWVQQEAATEVNAALKSFINEA